MSYSDELQVLARTSPAGLAVATTFDHPQPWRLAPHLDLIDQIVVDAVAGRGPRRVVLEAPPRHGKSELISHHTPPWFLGCFPEKRVILCTHGAQFARLWGRKARDVLQQHGEALYGVRVRSDTHAADEWELEGHNGGMVTAGVGGPITGRGADLLIIDDPIKIAEQALSEVIREKHKDWWRSTASTRLHPGAIVIVLMTRWHEDDLAGFLLREGVGEDGEPWQEVRLPAVAGPDDPLHRKAGETLWPEQGFDKQWMTAKRTELGPYWFTAMYQGTPTPDEGGIFKRDTFRYFDDRQLDEGIAILEPVDTPSVVVPIADCRKIVVADVALSEKETADYTVIGTWAVTDHGDALLIDLVRERVQAPDQLPLLKEVFEAQRPMFLGVEQFGAGTALVQQAIRDGLPVQSLDPDKDKVTRAAGAADRLHLGKVWFPRYAPWRPDFELELLAFPAGEHDDQVDMFAYAARAQQKLGPRVRRQREAQRPLTAGVRPGNV